MTALHDSLSAQGVHTLIAQFTDLHGVARGKFVPLHQLDLLLSDGVGFAGPSIWGTGLPRTGPRSEYYGRGDAKASENVRALPWMPGYARIVCDGFVANAPFDACPRQVLRRQIKRLNQRGWTLRTGIEPEFFLLQKTANGYAPFDANDQLHKPSYDLKSLPRQRQYLKQLADGLVACGLDVFQIDHEDAHGQFELNFHHADALTSADNLMLFKMAAHELAEQHGMVFSMMPKPFANQPGSGMHFHVSMWDGAGPGAKCVFEDESGSHGVSPLAQHFIAGVLHHSAALCALAAPTVNSYKRLTVGESISGTTWAPAYVAHGPNNRTALVRTLHSRHTDCRGAAGACAHRSRAQASGAERGCGGRHAQSAVAVGPYSRYIQTHYERSTNASLPIFFLARAAGCVAVLVWRDAGAGEPGRGVVDVVGSDCDSGHCSVARCAAWPRSDAI